MGAGAYWRGGVALALATMLGGCATITSPIYGVEEGRLADCEGIAGCISTQSAPDSPHYAEPLSFTASRSEARADLILVLRRIGDNRIVSSHRSYLRAEFTIGTTVDEVEFYLPGSARVIHMRSVTREGMADSGQNTARVGEIRLLFDQLQQH